jgi:7-cyano-7-deazaguanine synthase in queuosine biosynthesis
MSTKVLCFSGGPDSVCAVPIFQPDLLVYVNWGHPFCSIEQRQAQYLALMLNKPLAIHSLGLSTFLKEDFELPMRNAFLVQMAVLEGLRLTRQIEQIEVGLAVEQGTEHGARDRDWDFFRMVRVLSAKLTARQINVQPVLFGLTKTAAIAKFLSSVPNGKDILSLTTSCYRREHIGQLPCGNCPACVRRFISFYLNGIEEGYQVQPFTTELFQSYLKRAKNLEIDPERAKEIIRVAEAFHVGQ